MEQARSRYAGNWQEALIPFLVIGMALAIPGAYLLRSNPELAPWLGAYLALLWIGFIVWARSLEQKGQPPRKSVQVLVHIVLAVLGTAAFEALIRLFWTSNTIFVRFLFLQLFINFVYFLLLLWQRKQERNILDRIAESRLGLVTLIFVGIVITGVVVFSANNWERDILTGPKSGPSTSWATQLAIAQREALQRDKDALLISYSVHAWPIDSKRRDLTPDNTLRVGFEFISPDDRFEVIFNDNAPTSTIRIEDNRDLIFEGYYSTLSQKQDRVKSALAKVKLSPREAWQRTWQQALSHAQTRNLPIYPSIILDLQEIGKDTGPLMWHLGYWPVPENSDDPLAGLADIFNMNYTSSFNVDAQTGAILSREFKQASGISTAVQDPQSCQADCSLDIKRLQSCTLQDLIDVYGSPQKMRISQPSLAEKTLFPVQLYYPTRGLDFYVTPPKAFDDFEPAPDMAITAYQCYSPTDLQSHIDQESSTGISILADWPGFKP